MLPSDMTIAFFAGVLFVLVPLALRDHLDHAQGIWQFRALHSLLTPAELTFYLALLRAAGENYLVLPKVCLASLIRPSRRLDEHARKVAESRLCHERVDFVLCRRDTLTIWCVIDLDSGKARTSEDRYRAEALAAADIPVISFASLLTYDPDGLRQRICGSLKAHPEHINEYPLPLSSVV